MKLVWMKGILAGIFFALLPVVTVPFTAYAQGQQGDSNTERLIMHLQPAPEPVEKDKTTLFSYYEPSTVLTGNSPGRWAELTNGFAYQHKNITGYASFSRFNRYDDIDYTANFGTYINLTDQYVHFEAGFGWLNDYMYNIQTITEYAHRIYKGLFGQIGYNYRGMVGPDSHTIYPGLVYYFGDSYMSADWGINTIEGRDTAYFGVVKGNFAITKFLDLWSGFAFGERLYDIYGYDASQSKGYILFGGVTIKVYKDILNVKVGGSYGEEDPKFIKRSLIFSTAVTF